MTTTATLQDAHVRLVPGQQAVVPLQIRNAGTTVEGYRIEVLGVPASWASVEPPSIDGLYPDTTATATITFSPPRTANVPVGSLDYGVRVVPIDDASGVVIPEGTVEILPFLESTAEILPRTSTGRMGAKHQIAVDNRGNAPVTATIKAAADGNVLKFRMDPALLVVEPGQAAFATVRVRPAKRIWKGASKTYPFVVTVAPENSSPVLLDAAHVQSATWPKWLGKALLALLALLILGVLAWFLLLKPAISSAARSAVAEDVAAAQEAAAGAEEAASGAQGAATAAQEAAAEAAEVSGQAASAAQGQVEEMVALREGLLPAVEIVVPTLGRLETSAAANGSDVEAYVVPDGSTLRIYSLLFNNPQGDFGSLSLEVRIDGVNQLVTQMGLENFRDSDFHFQTPIEVPAGGELRFFLSCRQPGAPFAVTPPPTRCEQGLSYGGNLVSLAPLPPAPTPSP